MHSKVAVADGVWATVGASNIDPFSLWLTREANLVVQDAAFTTSLRDDLIAEMQLRSNRVEPSVWRKLNIANWLVMRTSYTLVRLLVGVLVNNRVRDDI